MEALIWGGARTREDGLQEAVAEEGLMDNRITAMGHYQTDMGNVHCTMTAALSIRVAV